MFSFDKALNDFINQFYFIQNIISEQQQQIYILVKIFFQNNFVVVLNDGGLEARRDRDKDMDIRLMESALRFCQTCKEQGWKFSTLQEAAVSEIFAFYWSLKTSF